MPELLVSAVLLLVAGSLATLVVRRRQASWRRLAGFTALAAGTACTVVIAAAFANRLPRTPPPPADLPLEALDDGYVSSTACRSCHADQYATWHASYHRTMTQVVSPDSVMGDFDDVRLRFDGEEYRLFERDGEFFGEMPSREPGVGNGPPRRVVVPLEQSTGSHHTQIYWYPTGQGRTLRVFPIVYLRAPQRWVPRKAAFLTPPKESTLRVDAEWNQVCIACHTTHPRPRLRGPRRDETDSHVVELGIACEACHGPGREHVEANQAPARRYRMHFSSEPDPTIVDPSDLSHVRASQVCGQCHVVKTQFGPADRRLWIEHGSRFRPGDDLEKKVNVVSRANLSRPSIQRLLAGRPGFMRSTFWDDGIVRVAGREYNAIIESPCFQRGELSCLSCHGLHKSRDDPRELSEWADDQLLPGMDTSRACTQCHVLFEDEERVASHTHHPVDSSGSDCQNCHMPHTTYGLLKAIRAHEIGNPMVAKGPGEGRPNACNLCHLDRSLGWTAEALERWYGQEPPALTRDDRRVSAGARWALEGDAGIRALVAWSMGWRPAQEVAGSDWLVPYLAELMRDRYDAVRMIASRSMRTIPGFEDAAFDALGSPPQRADAVDAILDRWERLPASSPARSARTLFDPEGRLQTAEYQRLLANRDTRPLSLAE